MQECLHHTKSGQSCKYGDAAAKASTLPIPKGVKLKDVKDFSVVRQSKKNVEGEKIISGKPLFGIDYKMEGMLIAMIHHPPAFGMKLGSFDAADALKMRASRMCLPSKCMKMDLSRVDLIHARSMICW
jgi:isoquinoline 1-oxidoreductase beta subunit